MANFNLNDYVSVSERLVKFYDKYPNGSIQTEVVKIDNGFVLIKAYAYRDADDTKPCTGHAYEIEGEGFVNTTSYIENCETSAVGRALAMMGFEIKKHIASREEMQRTKKEVKTITESQENDIRALMGEVGVKEPDFLNIMKVKKISELPASKYSSVIKSLENKRGEE